MGFKDVKELKQYLQTLPKLADKGRAGRVKKAKADFRCFVETYLPHHVSEVETSEFRQFIYSDIDTLTERQKNLLFFVYRGGAKTTLLARLFVMWEVCRGRKHFPAIISDTIDVAQNSIEFIQTEFEDNASLIADFDIQQGDTWRADEFTLKFPDRTAKFKAFGSGKKIRGQNYLGKRPDLIILDDIENDENVESKLQRDKLENWFKKAIMKLPARGSHYNIIIIGTLLHYDAVLKRLENRRDFKSFTFPLVKSFPDDMDGWQKLFQNPDQKQAEEIYRRKKAYYDKGLVLDDPALDPFEIMMDYFEDIDSFFSEFQQQPISAEGAPFSQHHFYESLPDDLVYCLACDPALGKKKGDLFGVAVVGKSAKQKRFFCVYANGFRLKPKEMISRIITLYLRYMPKFLVMETVAFQEFYKDHLKEAAAEHDVYLPIVEVQHKTAKDMRIMSLSPYVSDGTLSFNRNDTLLAEELKTFPKSAHDDILDAVEMAFRQMKKNSFDLAAFKKALKKKKHLLKREEFA